MLTFEKVSGTVFISGNIRKWKLELLSSEIRCPFAVFFVIISAWKMFKVWISWIRLALKTLGSGRWTPD